MGLFYFRYTTTYPSISSSFHFPIGKYYQLPKGKYRFGKGFSMNNGKDKEIVLYAEFEIKQIPYRCEIQIIYSPKKEETALNAMPFDLLLIPQRLATFASEHLKISDCLTGYE